MLKIKVSLLKMASKDRYADPLALLQPDETRIPSFFSVIWVPASCGLLALATICFHNNASSRPLLSGIHKHILATLGATYAGVELDNYKKRYFAERDAVYRHYIELHPEDFPPIERKTFGEVLHKWAPVR